MSFFFLPSQATRQIKMSDIYWAAAISHVVGVAIGYGAALADVYLISLGNFRSPMSAGEVFLEPRGIPYIILTSLVSLPLSTALVFGLSRVGAVGFGSIILLGAAFGFAVASPWAILFGPIFTQASPLQSIFMMSWVGAIIGLGASSVYWFTLRLRCPRALAGDHRAKSRLGLGVYIFLSFLMLASPAFWVSPALLDRAQETIQLRRSEVAKDIRRVIADHGAWTNAASQGEHQFQKFIGELRQKVETLRSPALKAGALTALGRELLDWGEVQVARDTLVDAINLGAAVNVPVLVLARKQDVSGIVFVCSRVVEGRRNDCIDRSKRVFKNLLDNSDPNWSIDWGKIAHSSYTQFSSEQLIRNLTTEFRLGSEDWLVERVLDGFPSIFRGDALINVGSMLIEQHRTVEAEAVFELVVSQVMAEETFDNHRLGSEILFSRIAVAWIKYGDQFRARRHLEEVMDKEFRKRLLIRLEGIES